MTPHDCFWKMHVLGGREHPVLTSKVLFMALLRWFKHSTIAIEHSSVSIDIERSPECSGRLKQSLSWCEEDMASLRETLIYEHVNQNHASSQS